MSVVRPSENGVCDGEMAEAEKFEGEGEAEVGQRGGWRL